MVCGDSNMLKLISCGTTPMQALAASSSRSMSWPKTLSVPAVLLTSEVTMPMSVVLPAPFGPEQREEIALLDVEIDALQRLDAVLVGLDEAADGERIHRARKGNTRGPRAEHRLSPEERGGRRCERLQLAVLSSSPASRRRAARRRGSASWNAQPSRPRLLGGVRARGPPAARRGRASTRSPARASPRRRSR